MSGRARGVALVVMATLATPAAAVLAGVTLATLVPGRARADGLAVLAIDPAPPRPLDGAAAARLLGGGAPGAVADGVGAARERARQGVRPAAEAAFFGEAEAALRDAWKAYLLVDPARALGRLDDAEAILRAHLDWPGVSDILADLALRRGASQLLAGQGDAAAAALRQARALDPDRVVGPEEFHPDVVKLVSQIDAALAALAPATVTAQVAGADEVWIDGQPALGATRVMPGGHVLWARAAARHAAGTWFEAAPGQSLTVHLTLPREPRLDALAAAEAALKAGGDAARVSAGLEAVRELLGVDEVVVGAVTWRGGQLAVVGERCGGVPLGCGAVRQQRVARRAELARAAAGLVAMLAVGSGALRVLGEPALAESQPPSALTPIRSGGTATGTPGPSSTPWYRRRWVWAVGGAVILTGAAAALAGSGGTTQVESLSIDPSKLGR